MRVAAIRGGTFAVVKVLTGRARALTLDQVAAARAHAVVASLGIGLVRAHLVRITAWTVLACIRVHANQRIGRVICTLM